MSKFFNGALDSILIFMSISSPEWIYLAFSSEPGPPPLMMSGGGRAKVLEREENSFDFFSFVSTGARDILCRANPKDQECKTFSVFPRGSHREERERCEKIYGFASGNIYGISSKVGDVKLAHRTRAHNAGQDIFVAKTHTFLCTWHVGCSCSGLCPFSSNRFC